MTYSTPPFHPQSSPPFDDWDCSNEAFIGCIEMVQNNFQQFSVCANAVMTGTQPGVGNAIDNVVNLSNQKGLISQSLWSDPDTFTQAEYTQPVPSAILKQANKSMEFALVAPDLNVSPIILRLNLGSSYHFVVTPDNVNYIDSYAPQIKKINWSQVVGQWSLTIKSKFMLLGFKTPTDPTVYIQVGNSFVPLTDWQAFLNLGGSEASIVTLTQQQLDSSSVIMSDYFKSK